MLDDIDDEFITIQIYTPLHICAAKYKSADIDGQYRTFSFNKQQFESTGQLLKLESM